MPPIIPMPPSKGGGIGAAGRSLHPHACRLKEEPSGEYQIVVVRMKLGCRNLFPGAKGDCRSACRILWMEFELAEGRTRRDEILHLAIILAAEKVSRVIFDFRPEELVDTVLSGRVPGYGTAEFRGISRRQTPSCARDQSKVAESFACQQSW